ncbi:MAG TPA: alkaline phosphatase family protein [Gaiellaceae bacterium]|nr:alkaline phosphatase family protein [Gaiellaceae bacterium]
MTPRKLILVVIDGLTPSAFEQAVESGAAPTLARLAQVGAYRRAVSTFPSLTPVCLSSIATGGHPDVHGIPHLVWYHRGERRLVEYGSSFGAVRAAGIGRTLRDALVNMNAEHLSRGAVTVFEALEDAGLVPAAVNFTAYRGRTLHRGTLPPLRGRTVLGPRRFFFYNLFESDATGAPLSWRSRADGTIDAYAAAVGRWLVTRDGFDFLVYYLSDYDYASHELGPDGAHEALARADAAVGALVESAGGLDALLDRYALVVMSDHGQTPVERIAVLGRRFADVPGALVTASNRAAMVYRLPEAREDARSLAERLDCEPAVAVTLFREGGEAVARREREELRFAPAEDGWQLSGDTSILPQPDALARAWAALENPNAGEVVVSAAPGWEFVDLGGRHHLGGGSHGSLEAGDSEVPLLTLGVEGTAASIVDVAPLVLRHFGVPLPQYAGQVHLAA